MTFSGSSRSRFALVVREGLTLELADPSLAAPYLALVERNLGRLARWEPWAGTPQSISGIRTFLAWQAQGFLSGTLVPLVITLGSEPVGSCTARIDALDGTAEVGYWIDESREGQGIAGASIRCLVEYLLERGDIGRVQARTAVDNVRSRAMLERLGFEFEGVLRSSQRIDGGRVDMAMYALLNA